MGEIELPFPLKGLNDNLSFTDQPPATTVEMVNMRGIDPVTGRERGAQRSGLSKLNSTQISATAKVRDLATVTFDNRQVTYDELDPPVAEWHHPVSGQGDVFAVHSDRQGNVYALTRKSIDKRNSAGESIFNISVPLPHAEHQLGALEVDDLDVIYTGVSQGGDQSQAKLWAYSQLPDDEFEILWELEVGMYARQIRVVKDLLYVALDDDTTRQSFMQVYTNIDARSGPTLVREFKTVYPTYDFDVNDEGIIFTGHSAFTRGINPQHPNNTDPRVDWTPLDLLNASERIWGWWPADAIVDFTGELTQGDSVPILPDISGNLRHFVPAGATTAPTYNEDGLAGKPTALFDGDDDEMVTAPSITFDPAYADQQPTAIPGYTGSMFAVFLVVRLVNESQIRWILAQHNENIELGQTVKARIVFANRVDGYTLPGAADDGTISYYEITDDGDPASGTNGHPESSTTSFDNDSSVAIISFICDGGHDPGVIFGAGATRSHLRVNGKIIEPEYTSLLNHILDGQRTHLGKYTIPAQPSVPTVEPFKGDFVEMIVLRDSENTPMQSGTTKHVVEYSTTFSSSPNLNEFDVIEGYLAHKWGIANVLDVNHPFYNPIGGTQGPPSAADYQVDQSLFGEMLNATPLLIAWDGANGKPLDTTGLTVGAGFGHSVEVDGNFVYTAGVGVGFPAPSELIVFEFENNTLTALASVSLATTAFDAYDRPRMALDKEHDIVYVPTGRTSSTSVLVYSFNGINTLTLESSITLPNSRAAHAVALNPKIPDYDGDIDPELAEMIYIGGSADSGDLALSRYNLVEASPAVGSPRQVTYLAVADDDIKTFDFSSTVATPTGGSGAIAATARYVQSVTHFGEVFFTDGVGPYRVYKPREDVVEELKSTSAGEIEPRARLIESWRGRLVLARAAGAAGEWFMSKVGDPRNWDYFPPVETSIQATSGATSRAGMVPDIINCFIPYNDDLAIFGCDHHIYRLTGDPQAGGQIDLLSDVTGISFGRPWCKDPEGFLYFFGSRGGVFVMAPGGMPERITRDTIERRTQAVDLSSYYVRLEWNYLDEGLNVFVLPFGTGGTIVAHWFWDKKSGAWFEDEFGDTDVQPTAVLLLDGDAVDDRIMAIGCEDGYIRRWDGAALDDDGFRIDSRVLLGPVTQKARLRDLRFDRLTVQLASDQGGCRYEVFSSGDPARKGDMQMAGHLRPGQNETVKARVRGSYLWVRLRNAELSQRWAFECASIFVHEGGRKRVHNP